MPAQVKHEQRVHALLSASGASRWLNCPPSARLEEKYGEKRSTDYSREGTLAHELAELYLRRDLKGMSDGEFDEGLEAIMSNELFKEEMLDYVPMYTNYCTEQLIAARAVTPSAIADIEVKLDLTEYIPESFGTGDFICIADGTMEIVDLKYGRGVRVAAEQNKQLMLYALGALRIYDTFYDIEYVKLTIVQPRVDNISSWTVSVSELKDWAINVLRPAAAEAFDGKGELSPGSWCQFCSVKHRCRKLYEDQMQIARLEFGAPELLSDEEIAEVVQKAPAFTTWLNSVVEFATVEAENGKNWPGLKLVAGRSIRKWADEGQVPAAVFTAFPELDEEDIYVQKLKSLTEIERIVGKKNFAAKLSGFVIKPEGKPKLVTDDDPRPALGTAAAAADFKE